MGRKFGFSWSARRAFGISGYKGRISRRLGVPLTRSGRQRAVGRGMGCCIVAAALLSGGVFEVLRQMLG
ncbi:MAG: hypothetical protein IT444_12385 [Phycisphaeraceae bacterium]|nr:hypothetical protein [Phycisphaeraceae bacterium]